MIIAPVTSLAILDHHIHHLVTIFYPQKIHFDFQSLIKTLYLEDLYMLTFPLGRNRGEMLTDVNVFERERNSLECSWY